MSVRERHKEKENISIVLERGKKEAKKGGVRIRRKRKEAGGLKRFRGALLVFFSMGGDTCVDLSYEQL